MSAHILFFCREIRKNFIDQEIFSGKYIVNKIEESKVIEKRLKFRLGDVY